MGLMCIFISCFFSHFMTKVFNELQLQASKQINSQRPQTKTKK